MTDIDPSMEVYTSMHSIIIEMQTYYTSHEKYQKPKCNISDNGSPLYFNYVVWKDGNYSMKSANRHSHA